MPLPDTFAELMAAGYVHYQRWRCPSCSRGIEVFTTPKNKRMGFVLKKDSQTHYEPHMAVCPPRQEKEEKKSA